MSFVRPVIGQLRLAAGSEEFSVQPLEGLGRAIIGAQSEDDAPAMLDEAPGAVDEFLHHGLDAPALGRMAYRRIGPQQSGLSHQAKNVHGQRRELAHQVIGIELARGQPLQIEVGLELGVELLVRAVVGVQRDDGFSIELFGAQARAPAVQRELGLDQGF